MRSITLASAITASLVATASLAQNEPPVEQGPKNAPFLEPAFPNQTRAPQSDDQPAIKSETMAEDLPHLWAMEFMPDERILVTAKSGDMHVIGTDGTAGPAITGVPEVDARGQGGLLDVALSPEFASDSMVYFTYAEPRGNGMNTTAVARGALALDDSGGGALENVEVILRQTPDYAGSKHFGSRLAFSPDGTLFIGVGERSDTPIRDQAQDLTSGLGKVFRINPDGSVPDDNPFIGQASIQPEIWSYGHRNIQSAIMSEDGDFWLVEHGPRGGDELNRPEAGLNYGWPVITYGITYGGSEIGAGIAQKEGMEQPVYYWDPVIAPSGMAQYRGDVIPEWDGAILIGGLVTQGLVILKLDGEGRVATEDRVPLGARIRDVKVGPDGAVYALTEARGGPSTILRLTKVEES